MDPPPGPDPLALLLRKRGMEKKRTQKKKRVLILIAFAIVGSIVGYGAYAYANGKWPFEPSAPGSPTEPGPPGTDPGSGPTYDWITGSWSECSETCGGGIQTRNVACVDATTNAIVDDAECSGSRPATERECNIHACPVPPQDCQYGPWGPWEGGGYCGGNIHIYQWQNTPPPAPGRRFNAGPQTSTREIVQPAVGEGRPCSVDEMSRTRDNLPPCPPRDYIADKTRSGPSCRICS
eukprot:scaffold226_cov271-Pavlova_lutheri.AAC.2